MLYTEQNAIWGFICKLHQIGALRLNSAVPNYLTDYM